MSGACIAPTTSDASIYWCHSRVRLDAPRHAGRQHSPRRRTASWRGPARRLPGRRGQFRTPWWTTWRGPLSSDVLLGCPLSHHLSTSHAHADCSWNAANAARIPIRRTVQSPRRVHAGAARGRRGRAVCRGGEMAGRAATVLFARPRSSDCVRGYEHHRNAWWTGAAHTICSRLAPRSCRSSTRPSP